MPLVINSLGNGHTHSHARIPTICTGSILRNQADAGCRPACAWFKNVLKPINLANQLWSVSLLDERVTHGIISGLT